MTSSDSKLTSLSLVIIISNNVTVNSATKLFQDFIEKCARNKSGDNFFYQFLLWLIRDSCPLKIELGFLWGFFSTLSSSLGWIVDSLFKI